METFLQCSWPFCCRILYRVSLVAVIWEHCVNSDYALNQSQWSTGNVELLPSHAFGKLHVSRSVRFFVYVWCFCVCAAVLPIVAIFDEKQNTKKKKDNISFSNTVDKAISYPILYHLYRITNNELCSMNRKWRIKYFSTVTYGSESSCFQPSNLKALAFIFLYFVLFLWHGYWILKRNFLSLMISNNVNI